MRVLADLNSTILLITLIINLGLGFYVYLKNRKNEINRAFAQILFFIALWTASFLVFMAVKDPFWVLFWRRATPVGSALVAAYFLYFSLIFPKREQELSPWQKLLVLGPGYVFSMITAGTPLMVKDFMIDDLAAPYLGTPQFGVVYPFYTVYLLTFFAAALINLFIKLGRAKERQKLQIFYVLLGMGLSVTIGVVTSLLLPLLGVSKFFSLGPPFSLLMVGFVTYAIVKYRLLNIEDFLSRGIFFLNLVAALALTIIFLLMGSYHLLLPTYTVLANLTLGAFVLFQNPRSHTHQFFFGVSLVAAIWALSVFMSIGAGLASVALFWGSLSFMAVALIPFFFLCFVSVFPKEFPPLTKLKLFFWFVPAIIFFMVSASGLVVRGVGGMSGEYTLIYGPAFPLMVVYFLGFMGYGLYLLYVKHTKATGTSKIQIRYVFLGFLLGSLLPSITNLVLPLFGIGGLRILAPIFTIITFVIISYAILRHRLMSVEIVLQRSMVYSAAAVLSILLYALTLAMAATLLSGLGQFNYLIVTAVAAIVVAVLYQPLVNLLQVMADRYFFKGRYNSQKILKEISQKIASFIRLEELTRLIVSSFVESMNLSEISFLLQGKDKKYFKALTLTQPRYKKIEIDAQSPIIAWLAGCQDILLGDEIADEISRQEGEGKEGEERIRSLQPVYDEMEHIGIFVWVPIILKDELIGIIALGNKLSGENFNSEDIGLLTTLANQTAIALDNARLYSEVVNMKDYNEEVLQSMINGVMTIDPQGRVVTFNHMAEKITGRLARDVLRRTCQEIWGERGMITTVVQNILTKNMEYNNFETSLASQGRGLVPVAFSSSMLCDHNGKKIGSLITIQDMSEIKELEGKVRRADKLSALATMAAGMAHEIKNPLSSMKVLSQLLAKKYDDPEYRAKIQEIIPREINRIDRIVESLLSFARATALSFVKVDINKVLEENLKYYEHQAEEAKIKIVRQFGDLPEIEVDQGQIYQVFSNLVLNAIQAMASGGTLTISTQKGKMIDGLVKNIKVVIADTGHGISAEVTKKLFDPFYTTKYGGTGLGLTIAHNIVDGHKGYIDVASQPGEGTTFTVTLPVNQSLL